MDVEADVGGDALGIQVSLRRRSQSFSDDYSVQRTNDDATQCKYAAVQLKYWEDRFLTRFIYGTSDCGVRRDPEISIGYWARVRGIRHFVDAFLDKHPTGQIISLGCGFDTLFWQLKEAGRKMSVFVEVDFSSVTAKKIKQIRKPGTPDLCAMFSDPPKETQHSDLHCGDYHLVGADLRQFSELRAKLESTSLDFTAPTLVLAECVLVYVTESQSLDLLKNLRELFSENVLAFINYEQANIEDEFGRVMQANLHQRGLSLPGLTACVSDETHRHRFVTAGFKQVKVISMSEIYNKYLDQDDRRRIEAIERLDEMELLRQLLDHYCIVYALSSDSSDLMQELSAVGK